MLKQAGTRHSKVSESSFLTLLLLFLKINS